MDELLKSLIHGRDVQSMRWSVANKIVNEFYIRVYADNLGSRNPKCVDYLAAQALRRAGLGCFA